MAKLRYNFTFPFRWLKEDKKFLKKNLTKQLPSKSNKQIMSQSLLNDEPQFIAYGVRLNQYSWQPKPYKMDKEEMSEALSDVFPFARCVQFEKFFKQKSSDEGLPVMEIEIYY